MSITCVRSLLQVKEALAIPADVVSKAKLYDARLEKDGHVSSSKVIRFISDYSQQLNETYGNMQLLLSRATQILQEQEKGPPSEDSDSLYDPDNDSGEEREGECERKKGTVVMSEEKQSERIQTRTPTPTPTSPRVPTSSKESASPHATLTTFFAPKSSGGASPSSSLAGQAKMKGKASVSPDSTGKTGYGFKKPHPRDSKTDSPPEKKTRLAEDEDKDVV
jgi:hypothetical protein